MLWRVLKERRIERSFIERIKQSHDKTSEKVNLRVIFLLGIRLRHRSSLSSLLFNLLIAELEKIMRKRDDILERENLCFSSNPATAGRVNKYNKNK